MKIIIFKREWKKHRAGDREGGEAIEDTAKRERP